MNLQGAKTLPVDFAQYWIDLALGRKILKSKNILKEIPKALFVLRFEESKALLLTEMAINRDAPDPWEVTDEDTGIKCFGQVGTTESSFCEEMKDFIGQKEAVIFYGQEKFNTFSWVCPVLNISVHGFDAELVKSAAKMQVSVMLNLKNRGGVFLPPASKLLDRFSQNEASLKLSPKDKPTAPS